MSQYVSTDTSVAQKKPNASDAKTSSLDAHAQNKVFETIERISRSDSGEPTKTVIFITHRLSTARRADKIAMMDNGVPNFILLYGVRSTANPLTLNRLSRNLVRTKSY